MRIDYVGNQFITNLCSDYDNYIVNIIRHFIKLKVEK